jgi:chaperonin cofactor prefoldin
LDVTQMAVFQKRRRRELTDWREGAEWRRAQEQIEDIRRQSNESRAEDTRASAMVSELREAVERTEVAAILGDVTTDAATDVGARLNVAERAQADAQRRVERLAAAERELASRVERLAADLRQQYAAQWRVIYQDELAVAARATRAAMEAHQRLADLWNKDAETAAAAETLAARG